MTSPAGDSPYQPFFSPDGNWLGFVTPSEMKKVPVGGGSAITLCKVQLSRGASWGSDGFIVFASSPSGGLFRVSAAGGEPEQLTELAEGEKTHRWPQVLPGGKAVLFTSHTQASDFDDASIELLDLETGERKVLHQGGSYGRYVHSGHVVYVTGGTLFAIPFDIERMELTGSAFPILEGVGSNIGQGGAHYDVSDDGRLVYVSGAGEAPGWEAVWVDREGQTTPLWEEEQLYQFPRLSSDGTRLLVDVWNESHFDLWVYEIDRAVPTRLTFDDSGDTVGVWSPDDEFIVFSSNRDGTYNLYRKPADGSSEAERLLESDQEQYPWSISPDGKTLAYHQRDPDTGWDLWMLPLDGSGEPQSFLVTEFQESEPAFSPDGRWISYDSNESGAWEVYVRPVTGSRGKWQVSTGGGLWSQWARGGRGLYYWTPTGELMMVEVDTGQGSFRSSRPVVAVPAGFLNGGTDVSYFDVSADGDRFVLFEGRSGPSADAHSHANLIFNWFEEIDRALGD